LPLYFVSAPGCAACEAAEPELSRFEQDHPFAMVVRLRADGLLVERLGFKIRATPTYVWHEVGEKAEVHEGLLKAKELDAWFRGREVEDSVGGRR
jgi:hypothetical protein